MQYVLSESGPVLLLQPPRWLPGKLAWLNSTVEDITWQSHDQAPLNASHLTVTWWGTTLCIVTWSGTTVYMISHMMVTWSYTSVFISFSYIQPFIPRRLPALTLNQRVGGPELAWALHVLQQSRDTLRAVLTWVCDARPRTVHMSWWGLSLQVIY